MVEKRESSITKPKKVMNEKKAGEFLKLIKHNEFNIVK